MTIARKAAAEAVGTALLLATVVGSGIMGERLAAGNTAIALLANTLATGAALVALILTFGPVSGAHFNPAVTLADASQGGVRWKEVPVYLIAQLLGAIAGVALTHLMFGQAIFSFSRHTRSGGSQIFSEFVATFGLLAVIWGVSRTRPQATPFAVGAYITAAYWFTASTSFANPAVTIARSLTDTFSGIRPADAPGFIVAQLLGAIAATIFFRWLVPAPVFSDKERKSVMKTKRVLILCTGNSARSQMAEGILRHLSNQAGGQRFEVHSAGVKPSAVRPEAIAVMAEIGIDISEHRSKSVDDFAGQQFDYVITVCDNAKETCPIFPGRSTRIHQGFEDPPAPGAADEATTLAIFRRVRDEIRAWTKSFVVSN